MIKYRKQVQYKMDFLNHISVLTDKHIVINMPCNSWSLYFNYQGTFLLLLIAIVDADYQFIFVDIGDYRSNVDSSIFKNSNFTQA